MRLAVCSSWCVQSESAEVSETEKSCQASELVWLPKY